MTARVDRRMPHLPALDGLRGLAVVGVLLFHGEFAWAKGGYLGVSVFFTLSGFLITNLLVREQAASGRIALGTFWSRRLRRLMPAALATILAVCLFGYAWASNEQLRNLRVDLLTALGYVANWRFVEAEKSYADLFADPSPVQHFWSLAVEEQFYVVYPLVVFALLRLGGRRLLTGALGLAALASVAWSLHLRTDIDRVYYGTDTRLFELLAGALLALWWAQRPSLAAAPRSADRAFGVAALGAVGLAGTLVLWTTIDQTSRWLVRGVLPLQAVLSVAMIIAIARPGVVAAALSWRPLRGVGLVSYGLYLYHWPVFLVLDEDRTDLSTVPLFALRIAVTSAIAVVSYYQLEQPIRRRRVLVTPRVVPVAVAGSAALVVAMSFAVTRDVPPSRIAFAGVDIDASTVQIHHSDPVPPAEPTTSLPGDPPPPASVMIIGDSVMYDAAPAIGAVYGSMGPTTVIDASYPGFGLLRDPDGWRSKWAELVAANPPDLVVVNLGSWDQYYIEENGQEPYVDILEEAVGVVTAGGARMLWIGMYEGGATDPALMNSAYRAVAQRRADVVTYVDASGELRADDGTYPRWLRSSDGSLQLARKPDGWHLCPDGAARIAAFAARQTAALGWTPRTVPDGWRSGDWRQHPRYNDPEGGCNTSRSDNQPPPPALG